MDVFFTEVQDVVKKVVFAVALFFGSLVSACSDCLRCIVDGVAKTGVSEPLACGSVQGGRCFWYSSWMNLAGLLSSKNPCPGQRRILVVKFKDLDVLKKYTVLILEHDWFVVIVSSGSPIPLSAGVHGSLYESALMGRWASVEKIVKKPVFTRRKGTSEFLYCMNHAFNFLIPSIQKDKVSGLLAALARGITSKEVAELSRLMTPTAKL